MLSELMFFFNLTFMLYFGHQLITVDYKSKTFYILDGLVFSTNLAAIAKHIFS